MLHHPVDLQVIGIRRPWSIMISVELARFVAVLPFLWLIFCLRKSIDKADIKQRQ